MATDGHNKSLRRGHKISSEDEFDRELVEMKIQLDFLREFIQRNMEDHIYGWILKRKRIKWSLL